VQLLHILLFSVIDPLAVALQGGMAHSEKVPQTRSPLSMERTRDAGQDSCCGLAFICLAISEGPSRAPDEK
jgi:hypothetical protein